MFPDLSVSASKYQPGFYAASSCLVDFVLWQFLWSCLSFCQKQNKYVVGNKLVCMTMKINPQMTDSECVKIHSRYIVFISKSALLKCLIS